MDSDERSILVSLCEGKITFSEAAKILEVSKKRVEEMLESFNWIPSSARIAELRETEREVLSHIEKESEPIIRRSSSFMYSYKSMKFDKSVANKMINSGTSVTSLLSKQENVSLTYMGNGSRYKLCN